MIRRIHFQYPGQELMYIDVDWEGKVVETNLPHFTKIYEVLFIPTGVIDNYSTGDKVEVTDGLGRPRLFSYPVDHVEQVFLLVNTSADEVKSTLRDWGERYNIRDLQLNKRYEIERGNKRKSVIQALDAAIKRKQKAQKKAES